MIRLIFINLLIFFLAPANLQSMSLDKFFPDPFPYVNQHRGVLSQEHVPIFSYVYIREIMNYTENTLFTQYLHFEEGTAFPLSSRHCCRVNLQLAQITPQEVHKTDIQIFGNYAAHIFCPKETPTTICVFQEKDSTLKKYSFASLAQNVVREAIYHGTIKPYAKLALAVKISIGVNGDGDVAVASGRIGFNDQH